MAKPRPVEGLDPDDRLLRPTRGGSWPCASTRSTRTTAWCADPANVTELHDMRIACKRLRYLLEIFGIAFGDRPRAVQLDQIAELQDLLGDIHDCDVQIPMLEEHLAWLSEREAGAARRLVTETAARAGPAPAALGGRLPRLPAPARGGPAGPTSASASTR